MASRASSASSAATCRPCDVEWRLTPLTSPTSVRGESVAARLSHCEHLLPSDRLSRRLQTDRHLADRGILSSGDRGSHFLLPDTAHRWDPSQDWPSYCPGKVGIGQSLTRTSQQDGSERSQGSGALGQAGDRWLPQRVRQGHVQLMEGRPRLLCHRAQVQTRPAGLCCPGPCSN